MNPFKYLLLPTIGLLCFAGICFSQSPEAWVREQFSKMTLEQKIAQLMIVRAYSNKGENHTKKIDSVIQKYSVGGLCFFQGGPLNQVLLTNYFQKISNTPLMICMDAEWGVGMRLDSVEVFPKAITLGALKDKEIVYEVGKAIGKQCKRLGVNWNFAPVADVNNNPSNPVINDRSFGDDPGKVAVYVGEFAKGLVDAGVIACAKHFPGHGDVAADSHLELPVINKSIAELKQTELLPFAKLIKSYDIPSIMAAHLYVPALDSQKNLPSSLSFPIIQKLLKDSMQFKGIVVTDALEMKGVSNSYSPESAAVMALRAGNDILCLPVNIEATIDSIKKAIQEGSLDITKIDRSVIKFLELKYKAGLHHFIPIETANLVEDLNKTTKNINKNVAEHAMSNVAGLNRTRGKGMKAGKKAAVYIHGVNDDFFKSKSDLLGWEYYDIPFGSNQSKESIEPELYGMTSKKRKTIDEGKIITTLKKKEYSEILVLIGGYNRKPANHFGIPEEVLKLINSLENFTQARFYFFGNPYCAKFVCGNSNKGVACFENTEIFKETLIDKLIYDKGFEGYLPVKVCP